MLSDTEVICNNDAGAILYSKKNTGNNNWDEVYRKTPFQGIYVMQPVPYQDHYLFIKNDDSMYALGPSWFVWSARGGVVVAQSSQTQCCDFLNPRAKTFAYPIFYKGHPRYLLSFTGGSKEGLIVDLDQETNQWKEQVFPFDAFGSTKNQYFQPILLEGGRILVTYDENGQPIGWDVEAGEVVDLDDIGLPGDDSNLNMIKLDDHHFLYCSDAGHMLYHIETD